MEGLWSTRQAFTVRSLGQNTFQFLFQNSEDKDKILRGKTWNFDAQYLVLKQWDPKSTEFLAEEEKIKVWIQVLNLPLHWISEETCYKIGKLFGKALDVAVPGTSSSHGRVLKLLVEHNLKDPLLRGPLNITSVSPRSEEKIHNSTSVDKGESGVGGKTTRSTFNLTVTPGRGSPISLKRVTSEPIIAQEGGMGLGVEESSLPVGQTETVVVNNDVVVIDSNGLIDVNIASSFQ
ncbi:Unknown protein [Striga hermonthica]|uniref:DUF4283 domain-containing protein n=1 Tax=Striga hermonthica TaxID=68872 RepID=A0A9N7RCL7_STRHE|nr:Unknown protein [Striga hermonthica]